MIDFTYTVVSTLKCKCGEQLPCDRCWFELPLAEKAAWHAAERAVADQLRRTIESLAFGFEGIAYQAAQATRAFEGLVKEPHKPKQTLLHRLAKPLDK